MILMFIYLSIGLSLAFICNILFLLLYVVMICCDRCSFLNVFFCITRIFCGFDDGLGHVGFDSREAPDHTAVEAAALVLD